MRIVGGDLGEHAVERRIPGVFPDISMKREVCLRRIKILGTPRRGRKSLQSLAKLSDLSGAHPRIRLGGWQRFEFDPDHAGFADRCRGKLRYLRSDIRGALNQVHVFQFEHMLCRNSPN